MNKAARSRLFVVAALLVSQTVVWAQNIDVGENGISVELRALPRQECEWQGPLADQLKVPPSVSGNVIQVYICLSTFNIG